MNNDIGIYIHIPFCKSRCYYCDFVSSINKENLIEKYVDAICTQILQYSEIFSENNIISVYFGGGTPSYIDSKYIKRIMDTLLLFSNNIKEVTIEINPGTVDKSKLNTYKSCGINRLSIGLQSTYNDILKSIGRIHTYEDFIKTLKLAKEVGFNNISLDLMYPLPKLTLDKFKKSVKEILSLKDIYNIKHISVYNLELHENTKLYFLIKEGFLELPSENEEYLMKNFLEKTLEENSFSRYEISNFACDGFSSIHNLNYWNQGQYIGIGASASGFLAGTRYTNLKDIRDYINGINNGKSVIYERIDLDKLDLMKEYIILQLRLSTGVNINKFKQRFNIDIYSMFSNELNDLFEKNLLALDNNSIFLTQRGKEVANLVWEQFI